MYDNKPFVLVKCLAIFIHELTLSYVTAIFAQSPRKPCRGFAILVRQKA